jgi:hypothetical protein
LLTFEGFDIVIFAVGGTITIKQIEYIDAAIEGGARHFYPTECESFVSDAYFS